ncbi:MAG: MoxR family ATPase [Chloroflexi bacterium]|nr:MoxR family ATPase [Chloroflexota bacterium]
MIGDVNPVKEAARRVAENVAQVIVGKDSAVEMLLVAMLCEGHILIEDVPGIGKTMLAKSLARSIGCDFRRIQFTPDLLPSDITGVSFFNQKTQEFEFHPGPIISNIVLGDEINRATPRTQSALLESMEERQITAEGETRALPRPFIVLATQNPIELEGTFPLPEAQLDRFLLQVALGYPSADEEKQIMRRFRQADPLADLQPVLEKDEVLRLQGLCREVFVSEPVEEYIIRIVQASRRHPGVELGVSPRGSLALYHAAQALAAVRGRDFVLPDDVKYLAPSVLAHRLVTSARTRLRGKAAQEVVAEILSSAPVPVEDEASRLPR